MNVKHQQFREIIAQLLQQQQSDAFVRLQQGLQKLQSEFTHKDFFYLFAICPRWFAKQKPEITNDLRELDVFGATAPWFYVQFARLYILLSVEAHLPSESFVAAVNQLFQTADVNELILLVQSLQFIPQSERFVARAREAARSNIESVFCALAHNSDYAYRCFDQSGWNQLILKAAFLAVSIWSIYGLRERNNPELVTMLLNYVEERQAAKRNLPWDLWACIGWRVQQENELAYLRMQCAKLDPVSRAAIVLALKENENHAANQLAVDIAAGHKELNLDKLSWSYLAELNENRSQDGIQ